MIHRREGFTRLANRATVGAQAVKRLRGGHFMHQMPVDVQQRGFVLRLIDHMRIEQFFIQRFSHDYTPSAT